MTRPRPLPKSLASCGACLPNAAGWKRLHCFNGHSCPRSDFTSLQSLYRIYGKLKPHVEPPQKTRLAILGSFTTTQLAQAIELALFSMGGGVEIFEADYGVYRQEILDPGF